MEICLLTHLFASLHATTVAVLLLWLHLYLYFKLLRNKLTLNHLPSKSMLKWFSTEQKNYMYLSFQCFCLHTPYLFTSCWCFKQNLSPKKLDKTVWGKHVNLVHIYKISWKLPCIWSHFPSWIVCVSPFSTALGLKLLQKGWSLIPPFITINLFILAGAPDHFHQ